MRRERTLAGELPAGWQEVLADHKHKATEREPLPSGIFISAEINDALADSLPERMGWAAPTSRRRRTTSAAWAASARPTEAAPTCNCGVREHLMGAMANGMAAHGGVVPLAGEVRFQPMR